MKSYWFCVCPNCNGQGRMVIRKKKENGELFFNCDECESSWKHPDDIGNPKIVFLGFRIPSSKATMDEIIAYGWKRFATEEYIA